RSRRVGPGADRRGIAGALTMPAIDPCSGKRSGFREPTLAEILSDTIVRAVMDADGVDPAALEAELRRMARAIPVQVGRVPVGGSGRTRMPRIFDCPAFERRGAPPEPRQRRAACPLPGAARRDYTRMASARSSRSLPPAAVTRPASSRTTEVAIRRSSLAWWLT